MMKTQRGASRAVLIGVVVVVAIATALVTALLVNIFERKSEARNPYVRLVEVTDTSFPELLSPVDDLPPSTVITHIRREGDKLLVRGTTSDNGNVKEVFVSGMPAKASAVNYAEWEAEVPVSKATAKDSGLQLSAHAVDEAGNIEPLWHALALPNSGPDWRDD